MDESVLFNEFAEAHGLGGRFDPTRLPLDARQVFDQREQSIRVTVAAAKRQFPELPLIGFGFAQMDQVFACAFFHHDRYFIGYGAGTEYVIRLVFNRLLADPRVFPTVGDTSKENPNLDPLPVLSPFVDHYVTVNVPMIRPVDPTRQLFAQHLLNAAATFVALHELTHIAEGHVDYLDNLCDLSVVASSGTSPGEPTPGPYEQPTNDLIKQSIEMYADGRAILAGLQSIWIFLDDLCKVEPHTRQFYQVPREALFNWFFAVWLFCRIHGDQSLARTRLWKGTHPVWRFRQLMALNVLARQLRTDPRAAAFGTEDEIAETVGAALGSAESAASMIMNQPPEVEGITDSSHPSVHEHFVRLVAIWTNTVRPELERDYAFVDVTR